MIKLYAGADREYITPPVGTCLYGYRPGLVSTSVHDELDVTALAVGNGEQTAILIAGTLGDLSDMVSDHVRRIVSEATGIPFEDILFASTHTHCAPNVSGIAGWGEIDSDYLNTILYPAALKAGIKAAASMTEAEVSVAEGESRVGVNRRELLRDNTIKFGQNLWGPYDPTMTIIAFRSVRDQKGILNLVHYGCHGTACGPGTEITRDWPGIMLDRLEEETGTLSVFFNGALGDVGPRLSNGQTTGDISYVEALGNVAAEDAVRIAKELKDYQTFPFRLLHGTVRLPYQPLFPLPEIKEKLAAVKNPEELVNIDRLRYERLKSSEALWETGRSETPEPLELQETLIALGGILIIPFPYELFTEIVMRLRTYSGYAHTLCISCCNGYKAYLPTESELCRGGYEVEMFRYAAAFALADDTDRNLIEETLKIVERN